LNFDHKRKINLKSRGGKEETQTPTSSVNPSQITKFGIQNSIFFPNTSAPPAVSETANAASYEATFEKSTEVQGDAA